jgi:hypothetical protein
MRTVVVGGHSRNIGKTAVMAGLIHAFRPLGWTAVKITQYGHGICSLDGEPCGCAPTEHSFVLTEERNPRGRSDTSRFLQAGARRSLWLRVRQGQLAEAFPALERALARTRWVMIESNSIVGLIEPAMYLLVVDSSCRDFKPSARRNLARADALVAIQSRLDARAWQELDARAFEGKPWFPVAAGDYFSSELCRFVRRKLSLPEEVAFAEAASRAKRDRRSMRGGTE